VGVSFWGDVPFCPLTLLWLRIRPERVFSHLSPFPKQSPPPCPTSPFYHSSIPLGVGEVCSPRTFFFTHYVLKSFAQSVETPHTHTHTLPSLPCLPTTLHQTPKSLNASSKYPKQTDQMSVYHTLMTPRQQVKVFQAARYFVFNHLCHANELHVLLKFDLHKSILYEFLHNWPITSLSV